MGEGGWLSLINASPYTWNNVYQHSYQLNTWKFPPVINPGELAQVYAELGSGDVNDDAGEVNYTVTDPSQTAFQIRLRVNNDVATSSVYLESISTLSSAVGSTISIGFSHNIATPWILSGMEHNFEANDVSADWMHSNIALLGCQPLRHLCMPASHDAGMSALNGHTAFSNKQNTVTQNLDISGQLLYGARYFDIRPVIAGGSYATGHYSEINSDDYQGGNGQSISDIINQVNSFLAQNNELVILDLSHTFDTDHKFVAPSGTSDLSTLKLQNFIGNGPAVVVIIRDSLANGATVDLGAFANQGFYPGGMFPIYNSYSDTDNQDKMISRPAPEAPRQQDEFRCRSVSALLDPHAEAWLEFGHRR